MYRMIFVLSALLVIGCASSETILQETHIPGRPAYRWSRVDSMREFTDGQREVVFTYHLDRALEEIGNSVDADGADLASHKMSEKLRAIELARPERRMVNTVLTNYTGEDLTCRIYTVGSGREFTSVRVPAGTTATAPLREGERYRTVWTLPGGDVVYSREYTNPAYEGIPSWVGYQ